MMRKVCPKCKKCDEVTKTSYPAEHYERVTLSPYKEKGKYGLTDFDLDTEEEWSEYNDNFPDPVIECSDCGYVYDGMSFEDAWNEMVWRKRK